MGPTEGVWALEASIMATDSTLGGEGGKLEGYRVSKGEEGEVRGDNEEKWNVLCGVRC